MTDEPIKTTERRDERNIARLGIISIQSRVNDEVRTWTAEFEIDGRPYRVECAAPYGRPHGIDTDIILAAQTLFVRNGCPEHDWLHTTAYELRGAAGLPDNGRTYGRLRDSLKRLWSTGFLVGEGWHDPVRGRRVWSSDTLRYIERIRYHEMDSELEQLPGLDPSATLSIKLGEQLAQSIRERHVQVLDGRLLVQLEQPPARALYRLLEAHRVDFSGERRMTLEVTLVDWRLACGIQTERPELVRRALAPAHDELRSIGYLADVVITGRGTAQTIRYHFAEAGAPDPALVDLLIGAGVGRTAAASLVGDHGDRVEIAVAFVRHRQREGGVKNPAGLVVDFLRNDGKYVLPEHLGTARPSVTAVRAVEALQRAEELADQETLRERSRVAALSPSQQYDEVRPSLRLLLKPLGKDLMEVFEERCRTGVLLALDERDQAAAAMADLRIQEHLDALRKRLQQPA
ncbi:plasmid replication initiation protein [Deinococcus metalli]|uniref:Plasmid replication initiation protein n=1 Tax=Deinococcus metalli TaxID=1141878 RepID=A0A7W8NU59_9DEIO|nr:replication initiator protein A [Deinococcus metalli]MBB5378982.1 plasmid replication initiation protein [Deinococcus metalli]GHF63600.1 hypothetical protein GCM10017781_44440 [Deinococcus metalli]